MARRPFPFLLALLTFLAQPAQAPAATSRPQRDSLAVEWLAEAGRLSSARRYAEVDSVAARVVERLASRQHPDSNDLAKALFHRGSSRSLRLLFKDAATDGFFAEAARVHERMARPDTMAWIVTLDTHAWVYLNRGTPDSALGLAERALALCQPSSTRGDTVKATVWLTVARALRGAGRYERAIAALDSCQRIRVRDLGADHPKVAEPLADLGGILVRTGRLEEAASVLEDAIGRLERGGAQTANRLPGALGELAGAQARLGDVARSIETTEKQLAFYLARDGAESRFLVPPLYSIGLRLYEFGDHAGARSVFEDVLRRAEAGFGAGNDRTELARAMSGVTALTTGDTAAAARHLESARNHLASKPLDPTHMKNQVEVYHSMLLERRGDLAGARRAVVEGLGRERASAQPIPIVLFILLERMTALQMAGFDSLGLDSSLAEMTERFDDPARTEARLHGEYLRARARAEHWRGRRDLAVRLALACEQAERARMLANVRALPDQRALQLAQELGDGLDLLVRMSAGADDRLAETAWDRVVRWRGLVTAELAARRAPHAAAADTALATAHARWAAAARRAARLEVSDAASPEVLAAGRSEAEAAERRFASLAAARGITRDTAEASLARVRAALAPDEALVSLFRTAADTDSSRIVAFTTLGPAGALRRLDLGSAAVLSERIEAWRAALSRPPAHGRGRREERACRRLGAGIRALTLDRWAAAIAGAKRVVLVADGELADLPWQALPEGESGYLVESGVEVRTPAAEREILAAPSRDGRGLLALGDPDFGRADSGAASGRAATRGPAPVPAGTSALTASALASRSLGAGCDEPPAIALGPLPGARAEVEDISRAWSAAHPGDPVTSLVGAAGTERAFKADAHGRAVLHLATHGILWGDSCAPVYEGTRGVGGVSPLPPSDAKRPSRPAAVARKPAPAPTPWSGRRMWLALAGANHARAGAADENDGLLTADEVVTLDLSDADWVVLSACQSGVGASWPLEGSSGMRRAFRLAGAHVVIASQWAIGDESTREWMRALYAARTDATTSAAHAMAAASREVLAARRRAGRDTHPFHWAAFTATGD